jgi:hypothetical protein
MVKKAFGLGALNIRLNNCANKPETMYELNKTSESRCVLT